jgi:hypothetical protein
MVIGGHHFYFDPALEEVRHDNKAMFRGKIAKAFKVFQKKAEINPRLKKLIDLKKEMKIDHVEGWATLHILIDEKDLYSETGIISNAHRKGPLWERPIYFDYYENQNLIMGTMAGMRLHGGKSRSHKLGAINSFRVYLRNRYGAKSMPTEFKIGDSNYSFNRFVVHHDEPKDKKYINDFAYFITRFFGGDAPDTKPVRVFINGQFYSYCYLVEHQAEKHLKKKYDSKDLTYYRLKSDNDRQNRIAFKKIMTFIKHAPARLKLSEVEKYIDIQSYMTSVFPIIFLGTTDYDQGVVYQLKDQKDSRWKYLNWDMDHSFYDLKLRAPKDEPWLKEGVDLLLKRDGSTLRSKIFRRLISESDEFRVLFKSYALNQLNRLTPDVWLSRIKMYEELNQAASIDNQKHFEFLKMWFPKRIEFIKKEIELL